MPKFRNGRSLGPLSQSAEELEKEETLNHCDPSVCKLDPLITVGRGGTKTKPTFLQFLRFISLQGPILRERPLPLKAPQGFPPRPPPPFSLRPKEPRLNDDETGPQGPDSTENLQLDET